MAGSGKLKILLYAVLPGPVAREFDDLRLLDARGRGVVSEMITTFSGSQTLPPSAWIFSAICTRGPRMSSIIARSTFAQMISPAETLSCPDARARIFSDVVFP